ncbi:MAG: helix-turn-helix domain-containing protein [Alistipes sp.]|nr:helix-turn-helix domain-containing protein [Alistipes sp.]
MKTTSLYDITPEQIFDLLEGSTDQSREFMVAVNSPRQDKFIGKPFRTPAALMMLCTGGHIDVRVNLTNFTLTRGSVLLYGENSIVEYTAVSDDARFCLMIITRKFLENMMVDFMAVIPIFKYIAENTGQQLNVDQKEITILTKYYELFYEISASYSRPVMRDLFASFIHTLGDMYSRRLEDRTSSRSRQEEYFERFVIKVTEHHHRERSVKFYADELHITPKYLSTVIKEISGRSAAAWINEFVINKAKMLLKFSGKSIQEITYELNFSTQSFFGKFFKRHTGISPTDYRKND